MMSNGRLRREIVTGLLSDGEVGRVKRGCKEKGQGDAIHGNIGNGIAFRRQ